MLKEFEKYHLIRRLEDEIVAVFPKDKIKSPVHLSYGQELPSVLASSFYLPGDKVYLSYRCHAGYVSYGGDPNKFMAELYGKSTGCSNGLGGSMHLIDLEKGIAGTSAIVASHIPIAVGDAYTKKNTDNIVIIHFGDGATESGSFFESLNLATLFNLPILFICENNGWADSSEITLRRKNMYISDYVKPWIEGHTLSTLKEDLNFNMSCLDDIFDDIRTYGKPKFVEFITNKEVDHVGINNINSPEIPYRYFHIEEKEANIIIENNYRKVEKAINFAEVSPYPKNLINVAR